VHTVPVDAKSAMANQRWDLVLLQILILKLILHIYYIDTPSCGVRYEFQRISWYQKHLKNSLIYRNFSPLTEILHFPAIMVIGGRGAGA
jgi:hypothetical protein